MAARSIYSSLLARSASDVIGAMALFSGLPNAEWRPRDCGGDADWVRKALNDIGIRGCIPGLNQDKTPVQATQPHRDHVRQA